MILVIVWIYKQGKEDAPRITEPYGEYLRERVSYNLFWVLFWIHLGLEAWSFLLHLLVCILTHQHDHDLYDPASSHKRCFINPYTTP